MRGASGGLRVVSTGRPFPFVPTPPIHCRPLDDRLYVAGIEGLVRDSRIVAMDRDGVPDTSGMTLPLLVTGLALRDGMAVVGGTQEDGTTVVAAIDLVSGTTRWVDEVAATDELSRVVQPVAGTDGVQALWETGFDRSTLWTAEVGRDGCGPARPVRFSDLTSDAVAVGVDHGVAMARLHGNEQQLDLLLLDDGDVTASVALAARGAGPTPSLGRVGSDVAVVWGDSDRVVVTRVARSSTDPVAELSVPIGGGRLRSCDVIADGKSRVVVLWHTEQWGDPEPSPEMPGHDVPARIVAGWLAVVDTERWELGPAVELDPAGTVHHAGGWLDERLILVHGGQLPVVTVMEGT